MTVEVDLYAAEVAADPFEAYAYLREHAPVWFAPDREVWLLSRFEDVAAAAADSSRFSSRETNGYARRSLHVLVGTDPPEHTRLRRLAARAFSSGRLRAVLPRAEPIVAAHVDRFVGRGGGDAVSGLAEPLACAVFADLLGLDRVWLAARRRGSGLGLDPRRAWRAFFLNAVAGRRAHPAADLLSALLETAPDGDRLSDEELVALLGLLLAAGIDTTRDLVANLLAELTAHPEQWERLLADRALVPSAVEEALRYSSAIQAMFRTAACDVGVAGATLRSGARVMLLFGSADRDERRWPDADCFDVGRYADGLARGGAHIAFGAGPHACPGAHLARRIARGTLTALLAQAVQMAPAGPFRRGRNPCFRSPISLPLHVTRRSSR